MQKKISLCICEEERSWIIRVQYLEPWLQDNVKHMRQEGDQYIIYFEDREDVFDCMGAIMFHRDMFKEEWDADPLIHRLRKLYLGVSCLI